MDLRTLASRIGGRIGARARARGYGGGYFGEGRDPLDRMGLSGYERYDRDTSNADVAAYLAWRWFRPRTSLDVGAARGFVVEALRELDVDARGLDVSEWAVEHPADGARGHLQVGDITKGLPLGNNSADLVTVLETLEHLPPTAIRSALSEIARVSSRWVMATIPSFGSNPNGPDGWFQVKARDDRVAHYESLGPEYRGPLPYDDLYRDAQGEPIEGHLTIASYSWWEEQFGAAGLVRCHEHERRMHVDLYRFGLTKYWNLYVFRHADAPQPPDPGSLADDAEARAVEQRWGLDQRRPDPADRELLRSSHGPDLDAALGADGGPRQP